MPDQMTIHKIKWKERVYLFKKERIVFGGDNDIYGRGALAFSLLAQRARRKKCNRAIGRQVGVLSGQLLGF